MVRLETRSIPVGCIPPIRQHTGGLPDRDIPGQRPPWTETPQTENPWTETHLDRDPTPLDRDLTPLDRDLTPLDRDPQTRDPHPWTETPRQRPPRRNMGPGSQTGSDIQRPPPSPVDRMIDMCKSITLPQTSFAGGNKITFYLHVKQCQLFRLNNSKHCSISNGTNAVMPNGRASVVQ